MLSYKIINLPNATFRILGEVGTFLDLQEDSVGFPEEIRFEEPELETDEDLAAFTHCIKTLHDKDTRVKELYLEGLKIAGADGSLANVGIKFTKILQSLK